MRIAYIKLLAEFLSKALKVRRLLEKSGSFEYKALTILQTQALKFIKSHPKTSVGSLVNELNITFSAATQLTNRLVDGGWISRENNPNDRRGVTISLTTKGEKQLGAFTKKLFSTQYAVFTSIPERDLKEMVRIFTNILDSLHHAK